MPQDPILLMSVVNTLLRDEYSNIESLCEGRDWDVNEVVEKLNSAGFTYNSEQNQFR